ncbi:hypothetical protein N005_03200 [Pseudomonas mediterranea CFBP 5447]|nr:hypothetical protein N005_03200 [Pseudomonas mediterranea CFBP 5447]
MLDCYLSQLVFSKQGLQLKISPRRTANSINDHIGNADAKFWMLKSLLVIPYQVRGGYVRCEQFDDQLLY